MTALEKIRAGLAPAAANVPLVRADIHDLDSLDDLVKQTSVICSTVGPYARHGSDLVASCARYGVDYCDISGEIHWMRRMIDAHQHQAQASGARIVQACGFDSIPSDMGVYYLQNKAREFHGSTCERIKFRLKRAKGRASGGTIASLLGSIEAAKQDGTIEDILIDPYSLNSRSFCRNRDAEDWSGVSRDADFDAWIAPFVMGPVNTRVVRRSHELMIDFYGEEFCYDEAVLTGRGILGCIKAIGAVATQHIFERLLDCAPARFLAEKFILPEPGDGPSEEDRQQGFFEILLLGKLTDGTVLRAQVSSDEDPGYNATARMLAESAVCLARDELSVDGGFWTPSSAMGDLLLNRLRDNAGLRFEFLGDGAFE